MTVRYAVIFEQADSNWAAYAPDLPGCVTTGNTLEETERNIREAIEEHLRTLREFGDPVPHPTSVAKEIENSAGSLEHSFANDSYLFLRRCNLADRNIPVRQQNLKSPLLLASVSVLVRPELLYDGRLGRVCRGSQG